MENKAKQTEEKILHPKSGWAMLVVNILLIAAGTLPLGGGL